MGLLDWHGSYSSVFKDVLEWTPGWPPLLIFPPLPPVISPATRVSCLKNIDTMRSPVILAENPFKIQGKIIHMAHKRYKETLSSSPLFLLTSGPAVLCLPVTPAPSPKTACCLPPKDLCTCHIVSLELDPFTAHFYLSCRFLSSIVPCTSLFFAPGG